MLGYDLVDRWARYVEESASGFSAYPTVTMRFGGSPDFESLKQPGVVRMVDVTTGGDGADVAFGWSATSAKTKYVCENAITARPAPGVPLQQGHTYALFVTNGAKAPGGVAIEVSTDLKAVLGAADPGAPLTQAWSSYAPLRTWAATKSLDLTSLVERHGVHGGQAHRARRQDRAHRSARLPPPVVRGGSSAAPAHRRARKPRAHARAALPMRRSTSSTRSSRCRPGRRAPRPIARPPRTATSRSTRKARRWRRAARRCVSR